MTPCTWWGGGGAAEFSRLCGRHRTNQPRLSTRLMPCGRFGVPFVGAPPSCAAMVVAMWRGGAQSSYSLNSMSSGDPEGEKEYSLYSLVPCP
eukprot:scaffold237806_cov33-Tisochrysis_lutea.AAC.3